MRSGNRIAANRVASPVDADPVVDVAAIKQPSNVGPDVVSGDREPCRARSDPNSISTVPRNHIALGKVICPVTIGSDSVGSGTAGDVNTMSTIGQRRGPGGVETDDVGLNHVAGGCGLSIAIDDDAAAGVARDDVALAGAGSANFGTLDAVVDHNAVTLVGDRECSVVVGADVVAVNLVVIGPGVVNFNAVRSIACAGIPVARDHVAFARRSVTADRVVVRPAADHDPVTRVAKSCVARAVHADVVALNDRQSRRRIP